MKKTYIALMAALLATAPCSYAYGAQEQAPMKAAKNKEVKTNAPQAKITVQGVTEEVTFLTPSIVRVVKYDESLGQRPAKKSYSVVLTPQKTNIVTTDNSQSITLASQCIKVSVNKQNGQVTFTSADGKQLLKENGKPSLTRYTNGAEKDKYKVEQDFTLQPDEVIIGFGQRNNGVMNQRGQNIRFWSGNTNITIPYFTSEKGYGFYWDNAGESWFDDTQEGKTSFSSSSAMLIDYYVMYSDGSQDGVMSAVRQLSGQATMFPLWCMGHWQCRERYSSSDELCDVLDKYRELQVPLDGIVQDWQYWGCDSNWNAMRFMNPKYINKMNDPAWIKYLPTDDKKVTTNTEPRIKSPEEMVKYVHNNNAHLMISIWANFGPWTDQYRELKKINALLPFDTWPRNRGVLPYDCYNPKARDIYWKYLTNLYKMGFDAWWTDSTEPDHFEKDGDMDYMTYDGTWRSVKNAFPLMTNKGIYEHQRAMKGNQKRSVQMTRCGAFGLQHYGAFSWSGDIGSNWQTMKAQVPSGLNYVICGIPFWNTDIGGFFAWDYNNDPHNPAFAELQTRWMQWGCFMPLMRNHTSGPLKNEIYRWGKPGEWAYDCQKKFIELRYRLLPYIYSTAGATVQNSEIMMRPLLMDFTADRQAITLNDEYMFGRKLLVKPVTSPLYTWKDENKQGHAISNDITKIAAPVSVYLPKNNGGWYDFWTNEKKEGGKNIQRACPIDIMPVYVPAGAIIPFGPAVQYSSQKPWDNLEIRVYPGADGSFTLYEDEGDGYNYEKGAFSTINFKWNDKDKTLTIEARDGQFKGMLKERQFNVVLVNNQTPSGDKIANGKSIHYDGKATTVKL